MHEWLAIIAMLKQDYGMTHGAAHRVSLVARQSAGPPVGAVHDSDPVSTMYSGRKASLRPVHDALMTAIMAFGDDIEVAPRRG